MKLKMLVREALTAARASPVPSALVLLVVAAMCFAAVATVGRQAAAEAALAQSLAGPAARTLTVTDTSGSGILRGSHVHVLDKLDHAGTVIGRERPVDAVNGTLGPGSPLIAVVGLHGNIGQAIDLTHGRLPGPGEVILAQPAAEELRLEEPAGYLQTTDGTQWAIVGAFQARAPFEDLANVAITRPGTARSTSVLQVSVVADQIQNTRLVQDASLAIIDADPRQVQVSTAAALNATNKTVTGQLTALGRSTLLLILGVGSFFVAVVVLADVLVRRRDLGRRRTLGITRADLVTLVALRTLAPAAIGATLGAGAGHLTVAQGAGPAPLEFTIAVAVLATLTAALACLPPATYAAGRDPVEVMRTP